MGMSSNSFGGGSGGGFGMGGFGNNLSSFLGGLGIFGNPGSPYEDAMKQYKEWASKGEGAQNPFLEFGKRGMPGYEQWLSGMKDPSAFINNLMGGYKESPFAKYQQEQGMRAAQTMGSRGDTAMGGAGSTPLMQAAQTNAQNISSGDMDTWLKNVLGVNHEYGAGLNNQIGYGQHAADQLTGMYGDMGRQMGEQAFNRETAKQNGRYNMWGGLFGLGGNLASMFGGF
jgi:hypothetical protein